MQLSKLYKIHEHKDREFYGGPTRWDGSGDQNGQVYDETKWESDEAIARWDRLERMYGFVWDAGARTQRHVSAGQMIGGSIPPYYPEDGQTIFGWLMFVDDFSLGQELRMAIQDGPWSEILKVANEIATEAGFKLPPVRGGMMS